MEILTSNIFQYIIFLTVVFIAFSLLIPFIRDKTEIVRIFNSKIVQSIMVIMVILFATLLLFIHFYLSKVLQIEIPKGVNYAVIFVYGYLVIKIINSFFEIAKPDSNDISKESNNTYADEMYSEVERKVRNEFLQTLHNSKNKNF